MAYTQHVETHTDIKVNQGQALLHLANMYPTLLAVILELVQNALDTDVRANRIWITINYKTRDLSVRDNGDGTTVEKFNWALASVANRSRKGEGSLGQFGIGLISPLGKCDRFVFTSCPQPHEYGFKEWDFVTDNITKQSSGVSIPIRTRHDITLDKGVDAKSGKTLVPWRSEMRLIKFTTDSYISRMSMDTLIGGIQDRYATTMRRNKTVVSVEITDQSGKTERRDNVTALDFKGRPLGEQVYENVDAGKTTFRLFVSPNTAKGRKGRVSVGVAGNDFRIPFHYFARSTANLMLSEASKALSSGLFEGEIVAEKVKLHPDRNAFERNDAFVGLCCAIEEWFEDKGSQCLDELKHSRQEERFQALGLRSMKVLEDLFKDPTQAPLLDVISSFGRGTVGEGHARIPKKNVVGRQEQSALSIDGKPGIPRETDDTGKQRSREEADDEKKLHTPLTVAGPKGQQRKVVKSSSFGLQLAHEAMEGSPELWKLDTQEGVLVFNIRHRLWSLCEDNDTTLMRFQEYIIMQALTVQMMPENYRPHQREMLDQLNYIIAPWIAKSDKVRTPVGRKPSAEGK